MTPNCSAFCLKHMFFRIVRLTEKMHEYVPLTELNNFFYGDGYYFL
jgi:hypothetical protein